MVQSRHDRLQSFWPRRAPNEAPEQPDEAGPPRERDWSRQLAQYMADNPVITLAAAALAGAALGWMVKRK